MSKSLIFKCSKCCKILNTLGGPICEICDAGILAAINREIDYVPDRRTPILCEACFQEHLADHAEPRCVSG